MSYDDENSEDMNNDSDNWNYGVPVNTYEDMYEATEEDDRDAQYYDDLNGEIIDQIEEYIESDAEKASF